MTCGIYLIVNHVNKKLYIGSSTNTEKRFKEHQYQLANNIHINTKLQNSYNKHGEECFGYAVLEECLLDNLLEREQFWLDYTKCYEKGCNILPCAGSNRGFKFSEESKAKMSAWQIGRKMSDEAKLKMSKTAKERAALGLHNALGTKHTEEYRENARIRASGRKHTEEHKAKIGAAGRRNRNNFLQQNMLNQIAGLMSMGT